MWRALFVIRNFKTDLILTVAPRGIASDDFVDALVASHEIGLLIAGLSDTCIVLNSQLLVNLTVSDKSYLVRSQDESILLRPSEPANALERLAAGTQIIRYIYTRLQYILGSSNAGHLALLELIMRTLGAECWTPFAAAILKDYLQTSLPKEFSAIEEFEQSVGIPCRTLEQTVLDLGVLSMI